jgi:hypothetical protein
MVNFVLVIPVSPANSFFKSNSLIMANLVLETPVSPADYFFKSKHAILACTINHGWRVVLTGLSNAPVKYF